MLAIILALSPIIYYFITGDMILTLPIYLPEMNAETFHSFMLAICVQAAVIIAASYLNFSFDTLIIIIFANTLMVASVIIEDLNELQTILKWRTASSLESKLRLIKIITMHKTYNEWVTFIILVYISQRQGQNN